jgi:hypothetical protein
VNDHCDAHILTEISLGTAMADSSMSRVPSVPVCVVGECNSLALDLLGTKVDFVLRDALKPNIGKRKLAEAVPI